MSIWRFADWFTDLPPEHRLTLGEGDTPLVRSRRIGPSLGLKDLWFKLEYVNPTGSYKDRFASAAISDMVARGKTHCLATSSGNTGASLAAYCAAAGIKCTVIVVEGAPIGKLRQMLAYGASVYRVRGFGPDLAATRATFDNIEVLSRRPDCALQISAYYFSAPGMRGVQSMSYELAEQSADRPIDHVFCPAGGGGMTLSVARGFEDLVQRGKLARSPRVECVQPEGNSTIAGPLRQGLPRAQAVECTTKVSGLQVPEVYDGHNVLEMCRKSGGTGHCVTDDSVWQAQARLAHEEGIFSEPAGAVSLAGVIDAVARGEIDPNARVVSLVTGMGFKDPASVEQMTGTRETEMIEPTTLLEWAAK